MATSSHDNDLALLRAALLDADAQTQAFLAPLLPLRAVQQVLLSFLRDRSRSFTDWVWDPRVHQLIQQLREQNPQAHHHAQDVDRWFERAAQDQWTYQQSMAAATPTSALEDADAAQEDGKRKFKQRDFYAAANAFRKSLDSLSAYNESESDDGGLAVHEWEQEMQERYVTLCTNVAICGLKMNDLSVVREFAQRALAVDATSSKALYATAKLHLLEHMHDAARAVVDRALLHHPTNQLLVKFRDEIDAAREKEAGEQALLAALAKAKLEEAAAEQQEQAARQKAWEDARVTASDFVPLPPLHDDTLAMAHINTYFMRIKQKVQVEITQLHNPDYSEPPLFECSMSNGATGVVLAAGVRGSSKKAVKNDAAKLAIKKLWELKTDAGTLLEEDRAYLAKYEQALGEGAPPLVVEHVAAPKEAKEPEDEQGLASALSVKISAFERALDRVMLLNQLNQQKRLHVQFVTEDLLPDSKSSTEFRCSVRINGEVLGVGIAPNKKKARTDAAKQAFAAALERKLVFYWDPPEEDLDADDADAAQQS